jgi:hypothetical protein
VTDRTWFRVHVYACPDDQFEAVAKLLLDDEGLAYEYVDVDVDDIADAGVSLNDPLTAAEWPTEHSIEPLAVKLREAAPGASWVMWTDPSSGGLGQLCAYAPELGPYGPVACDAGGDVVFTLAQVVTAIEQGTRPGEASGQGALVVYEAMGGPWKYDWEAHQ